MLTRRLSSLPFIEIKANDYMWNWTDPLFEVTKKILPSLVPLENIGVLNLVSEKDYIIIIIFF